MVFTDEQLSRIQAAPAAIFALVAGADGGVEVAASPAGDRVELRFVPVTDGPASGASASGEAAAAMTWLLSTSGGWALDPTTGALGFSLPSLGAGRSGA